MTLVSCFNSSSAGAGSKTGKDERGDAEPFDMAGSLLAAADRCGVWLCSFPCSLFRCRFDIPDLGLACAQKLIESTTIENVCDRIILADNCHCSLLKVCLPLCDCLSASVSLCLRLSVCQSLNACV